MLNAVHIIGTIVDIEALKNMEDYSHKISLIIKGFGADKITLLVPANSSFEKDLLVSKGFVVGIIGYIQPFTNTMVPVVRNFEVISTERSDV